jgi:hypothetical protein
VVVTGILQNWKTWILQMNENDNEEVNEFSYLSSVLNNTGGAGKM